MNLTDAAAAINKAADILHDSNEEARLVEAVRRNEALVNLAPRGFRRHCANMRLCDAIAALDSFLASRADPQGFNIGYRP